MKPVGTGRLSAKQRAATVTITRETAHDAEYALRESQLEWARRAGRAPTPERANQQARWAAADGRARYEINRALGREVSA